MLKAVKELDILMLKAVKELYILTLKAVKDLEKVCCPFQALVQYCMPNTLELALVTQTNTVELFFLG